ncbi:DUF2279 domain-containing protein [Paraflavisolibacter sp. H34]|uniref:DUF2279 domain-containing protein n=1 Tax=Huijunlia imazamoxiresistens TaxID=3127457 RepID=UPI003017112F
MNVWARPALPVQTQPDSLIQSAGHTSLPDTLPAPVAAKRQWLVGGLSVGSYGGSLLALNAAWYQEYPRTSFHTFNDWGEWLQTDKVGHAWTAYQWSRASTALWQWAGLPGNKSVWLGSLSGFGYMTVIELLDARSAEWGWSWGDMGANLTGSALFAAQQLGWKEQRLQFKFSAHRNRYEPSLEKRANQLFGATLPERLLKDYNAQTYWLSANLRSFFPQSPLPRWLNLAAGYGAENMFGGYQNRAIDKNGTVIFDRPDLRRYRQWYLAPDLDLTQIKTRSKVLKTAFFMLNCIKVPAPALEFSKGKLRGRLVQF